MYSYKEDTLELSANKRSINGINKWMEIPRCKYQRISSLRKKPSTLQLILKLNTSTLLLKPPSTIFEATGFGDFFNQWSRLEALVYPEENRCINEVRKYLTTKNQLEDIHTCSGTFHTKGNLKTLTLQHHPVSFSFKRFHMGSVFPLEKPILSLAKKSFQALTS